MKWRQKMQKLNLLIIAGVTAILAVSICALEPTLSRAGGRSEPVVRPTPKKVTKVKGTSGLVTEVGLPVISAKRKPANSKSNSSPGPSQLTSTKPLRTPSPKCRKFFDEYENGKNLRMAKIPARCKWELSEYDSIRRRPKSGKRH